VHILHLLTPLSPAINSPQEQSENRGRKKEKGRGKGLTQYLSFQGFQSSFPFFTKKEEEERDRLRPRTISEKSLRVVKNAIPPVSWQELRCANEAGDKTLFNHPEWPLLGD